MIDSLIGGWRPLGVFDKDDRVELLNLTFLFVQTHDDGFVVGLTETGYEVIFLRHNDTIDLSDRVTDIIEELTPDPVAHFTDGINVTMRVVSWTEVT